ncbi:MAG: LPS export ABC transporter periplasmic protein LptC [Mucilaginibacter polytrichastri]|nr:LPS export ABC transporter periplasmic protein LptC [Mucilaginibacter polytrichastri]
MKKVQAIANQQNQKQLERTTGVHITYSDSAKVKAILTAPVLMRYTDNRPNRTAKNDESYNEMPKSLKIVFYDDSLKIKSTVTSDYGIQRERKKLTQLRKNVVATNDKKETFKSDELIWDENTREFYSNKLVSITLANGSVIHGTSFRSNENFSPYTITQTTGTFNVNEDFTSDSTQRLPDSTAKRADSTRKN